MLNLFGLIVDIQRPRSVAAFVCSQNLLIIKCNEFRRDLSTAT